MTRAARAAWNATAVLTLFDAVNQIDIVDGNLKTQKLVFLAELRGRKHKIKAAHFRFFRYTYGPFSRFLANDVSALKKAGLLTGTNTLTTRGRYFRDYAKETYIQSGDAILAEEVLRETAKRFGRLSGHQLKDWIYDLNVSVIDLNGEKRRVKHIQTGLDIIDPDREESLRDVQPFDADTVDELIAELNMSPAVLDRDSASFRRTIGDALKRVQVACS